MNKTIYFPLFLIIGFLNLSSFTQANELLLRDNLQQAQVGDYLVISSSKTQTLMHIYAKEGPFITIEEIAVPESCHTPSVNWKQWVSENAPGNTSWVMFEIDLRTGKMCRYYSFSKRNWFEIAEADNFLSKLLTLKFNKISENNRKRIGPKSKTGPERRALWQPCLNIEGQPVKGVLFDAWQTRWPLDGSELAGRTIEIYLPQDSRQYPAYFPYWLQVNGAVGKAKIRIIDSGHYLKSPKPSLSELYLQSKTN